MPPFKHHVLVCTQDKQDGVPSCSASGGKALLETFRTRLQVAGLAEHVLLTGCGCLGVCERGPNVVIHPQGRWHTAVQPEEVDRIIREDLLDGPALEPRGEPDDETLRREALAHRTKVRGMMQARANAGAIPDELMNLVRGFQPARAILTAVELDLFSAVGQGASAAQVAAKLSTDARATAMLLNVAASFGLLVRSADGYCTTELSSKFLCADSPHDSRAALMHSAHLWTTWSTLTECVRKGGTLS